MKYYIYISKTKIDMLYGQINSASERKSIKELKSDIKVLSGSVKVERTFEETLYSKARIVSEYIMNAMPIGSSRTPGDYVFDTLNMKWGIISSQYELLTNPAIIQDMNEDESLFNDLRVIWGRVYFVSTSQIG